jgi:cell division GTPase FtsZ
MNLDFADIKSVMKNSKGVAIVGIGSAAGDDRAKKAAKAAITSPLLGNLKIDGATGLIVNITAGSNISLKEIIDAVSYIKECAGGNADVKMGVVKDESLANEVRMTVVATGIIPNYDLTKEEATPEPKTVITSTTHTTENTNNDVVEPTSRRSRRGREEEQTQDLFDSNSKGNDVDWDTPAFLKKGKKITTELV